MGHGKETPRQKMIGMMYLVLTALLALNVSKDVLDAFVNVDEGMMKTIENFEERNKVVYEDFASQYAANKTKVEKYWKIVQEVKKKADDLYEKLDELKIEIVKTSEGEDTEALHDDGHGHIEIHGDLIGAKDNKDIPAQIMIGDNNDKEGKKLRIQYEEYRDYLISVVENSEELRSSLAHSLNTDKKKSHGGEEVTWERGNFEHIPLIGVITIMTGIQTNIRNAEADVINYMLGQIDAGSFAFNKLEPVVIPNSNYILRGNVYEAKVFMAAFDTTQVPTVLVGKTETYQKDGETMFRMKSIEDSLRVEEGRGIYKRPATRLGNFSWGGLIKLIRSDGTEVIKPFEAEYQVAEGSFVASPTKMNVFYLGVENPVEVSVSGIPDNKINVTVTNAKINSRPPYVVRPRRLGNCMLSVTAEIDGKKKLLGSKEFRVKPVPDPVAKVAGKKSGAVAKNVLLAQSGVQADMENFDFDLQFKVIEFVVSATIKGFVRAVPAKGNQFSQDQKNLIQGLGRGDKVYIEQIRAIGPDGVPRDLSTITLMIN